MSIIRLCLYVVRKLVYFCCCFKATSEQAWVRSIVHKSPTVTILIKLIFIKNYSNFLELVFKTESEVGVQHQQVPEPYHDEPKLRGKNSTNIYIQHFIWGKTTWQYRLFKWILFSCQHSWKTCFVIACLHSKTTIFTI